MDRVVCCVRFPESDGIGIPENGASGQVNDDLREWLWRRGVKGRSRFQGADDCSRIGGMDATTTVKNTAPRRHSAKEQQRNGSLAKQGSVDFTWSQWTAVLLSSIMEDERLLHIALKDQFQAWHDERRQQ